MILSSIGRVALASCLFAGAAAAQTGGGAPAGAGGPAAMFIQFVPLVLIFFIFYFLILRPQQKRMKETQAMLAALKSGDRVLTQGGVFGTVSNVKDDVVVLEIAKETKIEVTKSAVTSVVKRS